MEKVEFVIDSLDKSILSKGSKIFHYFFGSLLIAASTISLYKLIELESIDIAFYSNLILLIAGILWIIRALMGRNFIVFRKYIALTNNAIKLKRPLKKEVQYATTSIEWFSVKPSKIQLKTRDKLIDFDITWLTYIEFQQLKIVLTEYGNMNKIDVK